MHILIFHNFFLLIFVPLARQSEIAILDQGVEDFENDDIALIFFVTVKNVCRDYLDISVNMVRCCEYLGSEESDCSSMTLIGGDMGVLSSMKVKNYTLIYPNLYLTNRRGVCTVSVTYRNEFKKKEVVTDIQFDTVKQCPAGDRRQCPTIDLDPNENCNPVDCLIKYSGMISYFDPHCKKCKPVPICNTRTESCYPDVAYSPYSNECVDVNSPITKRDLEQMERNSSNCNKHLMLNSICHYGRITKHGECRCRHGWASTTSEEDMYEPSVAQRHLCNIEVGDWTCVNKSRIRLTAILLAIFALTIITKVLLLICVLNWCYKHFRKTEQVCADQIDPDDGEIVICEETLSFDRCLCEETEKPKQKKLEVQTVDVSYYACCPSVLSSVKASSSSDYTIKTDQSIELSETTSSQVISFPEESTSESANDEISYQMNGGNRMSGENVQEHAIEDGILFQIEKESKSDKS